MGFGHEEDVCFLGVDKYVYFYTLGQPVCIPRCYVVYVDYCASLFCTVVRRIVSVFICTACFDKIDLNRVKNSCINLINVCSGMLFAEIFVVSVQFLLAWTYVIFDLPSVFLGAAGLSFSCLGIFVK
jgi:hypothetical protein